MNVKMGAGFVQGARENLGEITRALRGAIPVTDAVDAALSLEHQARALRQIVEQMGNTQAGARNAGAHQQQLQEHP